MARLPRYFAEGVPLHIIQRGNNRQRIFMDDSDFGLFYEFLREAAGRHGLAIHSHVFMSNHVHLLATPKSEGSAGKTLQSVGIRYACHFNKRYERTGTLWEGRYRATPIDSERYLMVCSRYIELNPVRAGVVAHPQNWRWSSYRQNAEGEPDPLSTQHPLFATLGNSLAEQRSAYRTLFDEMAAPEDLRAIRDATNKGWALGDEAFKRKIEAIAQRRTSPLRVGKKRKPTEAGRDPFKTLLSV